ncbi:hypothetical protein HK104_006796, partial [Borealophlyctis nickersoniae]
MKVALVVSLFATCVVVASPIPVPGGKGDGLTGKNDEIFDKKPLAVPEKKHKGVGAVTYSDGGCIIVVHNNNNNINNNNNNN